MPNRHFDPRPALRSGAAALRAAAGVLCAAGAVAVLLGAVPAPAAVRVDPELTTTLAAKGAGELVDALLLLDDRLDLAALDARLASADPAARREATVAALRSHAEGSQVELRRLLAAAVSEGRADKVRFLWIINGIAFRGDAETVRRLNGAKAAGDLLLDERYDMIGRAGPAPAAPPAGPAASPLWEGSAARAAAAGAIAGAGLAAAPTDTAWGVKWVKAQRVWIELGYTGAGVVVGHFDTGIWLTHPDIANRLWTNPGETPGNAVDDDGNGYVDDVHGWDFGDQDSDPNDDVIGTGANHGTHTAGTVAGDGTNGTLTGVAPGAQVMACKVALSDGSGAPFSAIYEAEQYAMSMGARVFTMSMGVSGSLPASLRQAERYNGDAIRVGGVAFFNSAGNENGSGLLPPNQLGVTARVPAPWHAAGTAWSARGGVIAVGGTGYLSDTAYSASSRGPAMWSDVPPWNDWPYPPGLTKPDVCAPAVNVNSLLKPSGYSGNTWSGTSMACPHAAGVAALMLQKNPSLSPAGIDSILEQTAVPLGTAGKDNTYGSGRIHAYNAVAAVPATARPYVVATGVDVLDAGGDGIIDPGETVDVVFPVVNNSWTVDATGITGALVAVANPYVSVTDAAAAFPDLAHLGGTGDNGADRFTLAVAADATQGYVFTLRLTLAANGGYQLTQNFKLTVGLPDHRDHDVGDMRLTVTHQAILGYLDDTQLIGSGCGPADEGSYLFLGSFWGGTGPTYICNRDYSGTGAGSTVETYEWISTTSPNGRVADVTAGGVADQEFQAVFSDAGHASPRQIQVTQHSFAWADEGSDDFVVLKYTIRNNGTSSVTDYHAGVFCDWDLGDDSSANLGGSDAGRHLTYQYASGGPYAGVAVLYPHAHKNLTLIDNPTYVYPEGSIADDIKSRHLKGTMSMPSTTTPSDYCMVTSAGPFTLAAGAEITVCFAMATGNTLAELQAAVDQAQLMYYTTGGEEPPPRPAFALGQNEPNPFNPRTTIRFTLEKIGPVSIDVFDLAGRKVRTLTSQVYGPGEHAVTWDGTSDAGQAQPSGLYLYRYRGDGRELARKMMLVR